MPKICPVNYTHEQVASVETSHKLICFLSYPLSDTLKGTKSQGT